VTADTPDAVDRANAHRAALALAGGDEAGAAAIVAEARAQLEALFAQPAVAAELTALAVELVRRRRLNAAEIAAITRTERT
jgi:hypothetical protein